jgi:hypothetical protein
MKVRLEWGAAALSIVIEKGKAEMILNVENLHLLRYQRRHRTEGQSCAT